MANLIDIGINLMNKQFQNDADKIIEKALDAEVEQMILTGVSVENSEKSARFAAKYPNVLYSTAGIHPHDSKSFNAESINRLAKLLQLPHVVSVGECGLDFDRDFSPRPIQEKCYEAHLELAIKMQKPLFLHERAAFKRFNEVTDAYLDKLPQGVIHCFTGSFQESKTYIDKGFFIGLTGAISDIRRFEHLKEVIQYVPLDRLMLETDAPYMLPKNIPNQQLTKYNERRNEPSFLPFVAATIAQIKKISEEEVAEKTTKVAKDFFKI